MRAFGEANTDRRIERISYTDVYCIRFLVFFLVLFTSVVYAFSIFTYSQIESRTHKVRTNHTYARIQNVYLGGVVGEACGVSNLTPKNVSNVQNSLL